MMAHASGRRSGVALISALGVLTLLALLLAGAIASATAAQRASQLSNADAQLGAAADFALTSVLSTARERELDTLPLGRAQSFAIVVPSNGTPINATVSATRLPDNLLWLVADATLNGRDRGRRRLNLLVRWQPLMFAPLAPILSSGAVRLRENVAFSRDTASDADCANDASTDVIVPTAGFVTSDDAVNVVVDARAADSINYLLASWQRRALVGAPGVVHVSGDTTITSGALEGILIVDGALAIDGSFNVKGLVIARTVVARGAFALEGALLSFASSADALLSIDLTNVSLHFDPCRVARVLRRAISLKTVHERSWSEIF